MHYLASHVLNFSLRILDYGPREKYMYSWKKDDNKFVGRSVTCISSTIQGVSLSPSYFDASKVPVGSENNIETILKGNIGSTAYLLLQLDILVTTK